MKREYITFYREWYEAVRDLPEALRTEVLMAMIEYGLNGSVKTEISATSRVFFNMVKGKIDINNKRYENGSKGGRPKTKTKPNQNQNETKPKPNHNQTITKTKPNDNQNETKNEGQKTSPHTPLIDNININNISKENNNKKKTLPNGRDKEKEEKEKVPPTGGSKKDKPSLPSQSDKIDYNGVMDYFNLMLKDKLPKVTMMTDTRKAAVKARVSEHGKESIRQMIRMVLQSPFLLGSNDRNWRADFDWLFRPTNYIKVLEGKYISNGQTNSTKAERAAGVSQLADLAERILTGDEPETY